MCYELSMITWLGLRRIASRLEAFRIREKPNKMAERTGGLAPCCAFLP